MLCLYTNTSCINYEIVLSSLLHAKAMFWSEMQVDHIIRNALAVYIKISDMVSAIQQTYSIILQT